MAVDVYNYVADGIKCKFVLCFDVFDWLVVMLNVIDYVVKAALGLYIFEDSTLLTPFAQSLVCLRLFKLAYCNIFDIKTSRLLTALIRTIVHLLPFIIVLCVIAVFGGAVSLQLFNNTLKVVEGVVVSVGSEVEGMASPIRNFDTMPSSMVMFGCLMLG